MLRPSLLLSLILLAAPLLASSSKDHAVDFNKLYEAKEYDKALALSLEWEKAEPKNPQAFIAEANCYFGKADQSGVEVTSKPAKNGDLELTDPDTHKVVGSIGTHNQFDPVLSQKGIAVLERAVLKHPYRVDIWFGLAYIYQLLDDFPSMLKVLERACAYTTAHPKGLVRKDGVKLTEPESKFMPETLHNYCTDFAQSGDPKDMEKFLQISLLMTKYYPKHSYGFDNAGGYYASKGMWAQALKYYLVAARLAPTDSMEWGNLGNVYENLGEKAKARQSYRKVILLNNGPEEVERAKKALARMDAPKK